MFCTYYDVVSCSIRESEIRSIYGRQGTGFRSKLFRMDLNKAVDKECSDSDK